MNGRSKFFEKNGLQSKDCEESNSSFRKAENVVRWNRRLHQLLKFDETIPNWHINNLEYIGSDRSESCTNSSFDLLSADYF